MARIPKAYMFTVTGGQTYGSHLLDFNATHNRTATSAIITNLSNTLLYCKLNGDTQAIFEVPNLTTISFSPGEIDITKMDFDNSYSGATDINMQVIVGLG